MGWLAAYGRYHIRKKKPPVRMASVMRVWMSSSLRRRLLAYVHTSYGTVERSRMPKCWDFLKLRREHLISSGNLNMKRGLSMGLHDTCVCSEIMSNSIRGRVTKKENMFKRFDIEDVISIFFLATFMNSWSSRALLYTYSVRWCHLHRTVKSKRN